MTLRAVPTGIGHYLPDRVVPNSEFEDTLETSDEWIRSRSGIERRHFAAQGETTSQMAVKAAEKALAMAGLKPDDIDAVIPPEERAAFMAGYKTAAGFAKDRLNAAPPTIAPGARVG